MNKYIHPNVYSNKMCIYRNIRNNEQNRLGIDYGKRPGNGISCGLVGVLREDWLGWEAILIQENPHWGSGRYLTKRFQTVPDLLYSLCPIHTKIESGEQLTSCGNNTKVLFTNMLN